MKRLAPVLLLAFFVVSCGAQWPRPMIERSPVSAPQRYTVRIPAVMQPRNKLGMAGCPADMRAFGGSWCYSWSADPRCDSGAESVPMIWDETHLNDDIGGCSGWLMGPNECDHPEQCNLSVAELVKLWPTIEERARARGMKLVAPVFTQRSPNHLSDFRAEFRAVNGRSPVMDALAVHCYYRNAAHCRGEVERYVALARQWGIGEVWVTEFFFDDEREARAFVAYLEGEPLVTRYSPFASRIDCEAERAYWDCVSAGDPSLLDATDNLTRYGAWYARPTPEL